MNFFFKDIVMDRSIEDPGMRISDLWSQWYEARDRYKVKDQFKQKKGKKIFRREMTKKLWPDSLKWQIEEALNVITQVSMRV